MTRFVDRHLGPSKNEQSQMLEYLSCDSFEGLLKKSLPQSIPRVTKLDLPETLSEQDAFDALEKKLSKNTLFKNMIGQGYYDNHSPAVITRGVVESPGWYTPYTPYQPEISQGRLEALFNYQTMITSLTGLDLANASLLDGASAAAEGVVFAYGLCKKKAAKTQLK